MMYPCSPSLRLLPVSGNEVAVCYRRASWARQRAKHANDPVLKQSLIAMEQRWLSRVHWDEFLGWTAEIVN
jgi:hypothetical protein